MSFSFNSGLLTVVDHIRFAIGDTKVESYVIDDETIQAQVDAFGYNEALAQSATGFRNWIAQNPDTYDEGSGGLKMEWKARDKVLRDLIQDARAGVVAAPQNEIPRTGVATGMILAGLE